MVGVMEISDGNVRAVVDGDLVEMWRAMLPRSVPITRPSYPPHLTVVRDFEAIALPPWISGAEIDIDVGECRLTHTHAVLSCQSRAAVVIRRAIGLSDYRDGYTDFHITIGLIAEPILK